MKKKIYKTDFFLFLSNQNSFVEHKNLDESMEDNEKMNNHDELFSRAIRAGKRTYFFDVKTTKGDEKYMTITESKRRFSNEQNRFFYEKHKLFLYKEDFEKFSNALKETLNFIETGEYPDGYFDEPKHEEFDDKSIDAWFDELDK